MPSGRDAQQMKDEATALAKARRRLLPFLFSLYIVNYLDRVNVGFAALQMNASLGFSASVYGLGAGIFFVSYTLFEVPSNLLMQRFGARMWIARIMISWGLLSAAMMFVQGPNTFYALRFLLGLGEAGFFPGIILYLTYWFPAAERARAVAYFMTATALAGAIGGPVSGILLTFDGLLGLEGWQWMFLMEGLPAVALGFVVLWMLPDGPSEATWLTPAERAALLARLADDHSRVDGTHHHRLGPALRSPRVLLLSAIYFTLVIGFYGVSFWLPQILRGLANWSNLRVGMVSSVPYLAAAVAMVIIAAHSDRTGERRWHGAVSLWLGGAGFLLASQSTSVPVSLAALALGAAGTWGAMGPFWTLPTGMLRGTAAAGGIAFVNSVGNIGGFVSPYVVGFAREATGRFEAGLLVLAGSVVLSGFLILLVPKTLAAGPPKTASL